MKLRLRNDGPNLTREDIISFEREIGHVLPEDFAEFILEFNGAGPVEDTRIKIPSLEYGFFGFRPLTPGENVGISVAFSDLTEESEGLPASRIHLLPFAIDDAVRELCFILDERRSSAVYVLDEPRLDPLGNWRIRKIADSFEKFIESMVQTDVEIPLARKLGESPWKEVKQYIDSGGDMNLRNQDMSILCYAVRDGNLETAIGLLNAGADKENALNIAVANKQLELIKELMERGGDAKEGMRLACGNKKEEIQAICRPYLKSNKKP